MIFSEYQELALRTAKLEEPATRKALHCGIGLITEVGEIADAHKREIFYGKEIDKVNTLEEVGDLLWYVALGCNAIMFNMDEAEAIPVEDKYLEPPVDYTIASIAKYASYISTTASFGSEEKLYENYMAYDLVRVLHFIRVYCAKTGIDYDKAKDVNIAKLKARYPDGFSEDKALNRDTEAERIVLEQGAESSEVDIQV